MYTTIYDRVINDMNKTNLKCFSIFGLFGRYDVKLEFDKQVNIFIGENGLGKTTILNCLYYTLHKNFLKLAEIKFDRIEVFFSTQKYSITMADLNAYNNRKLSTQKYYSYTQMKFDDALSDLNLTPEDLVTLSNHDMDYLSDTFYRLYDIPPRLFRNQIYEYLLDDKHSRAKKQNAKVIKGNATAVRELAKAIDENVTERIIYLPTYRRIENDFSNLDIRNNESKSAELLIRFGMADVEKSITSILNEIRHLAMQGYSKMTSILLQQYSQVNYSQEYNQMLISIMDPSTVKIILDRLGAEIDKVTKNKIMHLVESRKIQLPNYSHLALLLQKLIESYAFQKKYDDRINGFVTTCNKYMNDKYFLYDPNQLKLEIHLKPFDNNTNRVIELTQLSSGEKQIVSLFSKLYLESKDPSMVIIDEPELSLSIKWQQMLLPDIMRSKNCNFLLTVTHSPFIFDNEFDMDAKEIHTYISKH